MVLDPQTLLISDTIISVLLVFTLLFYQARYRTYPGFGFLILGTFIISIGYAASFVREDVPEFLSILIVNGAYSYGAVVRLDGISRFMRGRKMARIIYAAPVFTFASCSYFYYVHNSLVLRTLFLTFFAIAVIIVISVMFVRYAPEKGGNLYRVAAVLHVLFGLELLARAIIWMVYPSHDLFDARILISVHYLVAMLYEIGWALGLLMMNGQRLEVELRESEHDLRGTVHKLELAISEIKTLSGLVPICASCKKIRDDKGYWNQIETYISKHTDAQFSHGICPDCAKKLYPGFDIKE